MLTAFARSVYRNRDLDPKIEWIKVLLYHFHVTGGVALLAIGASRLQGSNPAPSDLTLVKVGLAILTVAWAVLAGWAGVSLRPLASLNVANPQRAGTMVCIPRRWLREWFQGVFQGMIPAMVSGNDSRQ